MEGINQIMKIPEAATNAAARSRPQSLQAQAAVETAAESQAVALAQPVPAAEV
jgi:hypothetical protein